MGLRCWTRNSFSLDEVKEDDEVNTFCYIHPNEGPGYAEKCEPGVGLETISRDVTKTGNGEWGMGNGKLKNGKI